MRASEVKATIKVPGEWAGMSDSARRGYLAHRLVSLGMSVKKNEADVDFGLAEMKGKLSRNDNTTSVTVSF